ncbi:DUF58 domain-containing protein [Burkholderiaceae bacterium UC74_6]
MNPLQGPRRRWQAWLDARHPRSDVHAMGQRNIYIVPSRPGLFFCVTIGILLIASINDQLSLGYMLTFLLAGAGLASMQATHGNLRGLSLDLVAPQAVFAGQESRLEIRLHNSGRARFGVGLRLDRAPESAIAWVDVPAQGHATLTLSSSAPVRGLHELPQLQIITRFPLGLFRAWSYWRPAAKLWVYPQAEVPAPPFPPQQSAKEGELASVAQLNKGLEFEGVRPYRRGDTLRQVLWKKAALALEANQPLPVRETHAPASRQLWLDLQDTHGTLETRLSRMTAWVLEAERMQSPYGLRLGGRETEPELGAQHRRDCLEQLALWSA